MSIDSFSELHPTATAPCEGVAATGPVVLVTAGGPLGAVVMHALARRFPDLVVIEEHPEPRSQIVRRRARLLGWHVALGQLATGVLVRLRGRRARKKRIEEIYRQFAFDETRPERVQVRHVASVNSPECRAALADLAPSVVAVYGTRIIGRQTLAATSAPFINYHAGINPKYRGQDPAYWALVSGDRANAGVTIHVVDSGVDTGAVLYQAPVAFSATDTISTYQYLQMGHALPLFEKAIEDARMGALAPCKVDLPSRQWFPPTIWTYLWHGIRRGIW